MLNMPVVVSKREFDEFIPKEDFGYAQLDFYRTPRGVRSVASQIREIHNILDRRTP